jgi:hypothetical protein
MELFRATAFGRQEVDEVNMLLSNRLSPSPTFRRDGTMRASELSRKLRDEVRRSPRVAARFAELLRNSESSAAVLPLEPTLRVTLNPIRAWLHEASAAPTRSKGASPAVPSPSVDDSALGADVVVFAVGEEIRCFAATMPERALLHQLAEIGPATLDAWLAHDSKLGRVGATRSGLIALVRATTAAGLTAVS